MRAEEQAAWCLLTGQSVDTYLRLSRLERDSFINIATRGR